VAKQNKLLEKVERYLKLWLNNGKAETQKLRLKLRHRLW